MIVAGIDSGSRTVKVVLWDTAREHGDGMLGWTVCDQGVDHHRMATRMFEEMLERCHLARKDVKRIIATGYGRNSVKLADSTVTEITCHAVGVRHLVHDARTVVEIGGQDSKLLRLEAHGAVRDFAMNDRCAAGTGRFLELVAQQLGSTLEGLGDLAARAATPATISSTCMVFAQNEIIGLLAAGVAREDIVAGVQQAIGARVAAMAGPMVDEPVVFSGGVALVPGMRETLERALGRTVSVVPHAQITGALGAAIVAGRECGENDE